MAGNSRGFPSPLFPAAGSRGMRASLHNWVFILPFHSVAIMYLFFFFFFSVLPFLVSRLPSIIGNTSRFCPLSFLLLYLDNPVDFPQYHELVFPASALLSYSLLVFELRFFDKRPLITHQHHSVD